jgi:DnaJ-domain-containing protein 1
MNKNNLRDNSLTYHKNQEVIKTGFLTKFTSIISSKKPEEASPDFYYNILSPANKNYFLYFFTALASKLITCDEQISSKEEDKYLEECKKWQCRSELTFLHLAAEDKNLPNYYANRLKILFPINKSVSRYIIKSLINIAAADAHVNLNEELFLISLANNLYLDADEFEKIFFEIFSLPESNNPFEVLALPQNVSKNKLIETYRVLAKQNHPDNFSKNDNISNSYRKLLISRFNQINDAYLAIKELKKF